MWQDITKVEGTTLKKRFQDKSLQSDEGAKVFVIEVYYEDYLIKRKLFESVYQKKAYQRYFWKKVQQQ